MYSQKMAGFSSPFCWLNPSWVIILVKRPFCWSFSLRPIVRSQLLFVKSTVDLTNNNWDLTRPNLLCKYIYIYRIISHYITIEHLICLKQKYLEKETQEICWGWSTPIPDFNCYYWPWFTTNVMVNNQLQQFNHQLH